MKKLKESKNHKVKSRVPDLRFPYWEYDGKNGNLSGNSQFRKIVGIKGLSLKEGKIFLENNIYRLDKNGKKISLFHDLIHSKAKPIQNEYFLDIRKDSVNLAVFGVPGSGKNSKNFSGTIIQTKLKVTSQKESIRSLNKDGLLRLSELFHFEDIPEVMICNCALDILLDSFREGRVLTIRMNLQGQIYSRGRENVNRFPYVRKINLHKDAVGDIHAIVHSHTGRSLSLEEEEIQYLDYFKDKIENFLERKLIDDAITAVSKNTQETFKALPDLLFEIDQDGLIYNYHAHEDGKIYKTLDIYTGKNIDSIFPEFVCSKIREAVDEALVSGIHVGMEYSILAGDVLRYYELSVIEKKNYYNNTKRFILLSRDTTKNQKLNQIAETARMNYQALFEKATEAIFVADAESGCIVDANEKASQLIGRKKDELLQMHQSDLHPPEELTESLVDFRNAILGKIEFVKINVIHRDGSSIPVEISSGIVKDTEGKDLLFGIFRNITERKKLESSLLEAIATKEKFLSIIAHDLRNPFHGILGITEQIKESILDGKMDEIVKQSDLLIRSVESAYKLLENLLEWSVSANKSFLPDPKEFNLSSLLPMVLENLGQMIQNKRIKIQNSLPDILNVYADENMIMTVIRNLVTNAIKFSYPDGIIHFIGGQRDGVIFFSVKDNGVGIAESSLDKLFKIGEKILNKNRSDEKGTGLGLLLCQEIIMKNHGKIFASNSPDGGTVFTIELPVSEKTNRQS